MKHWMMAALALGVSGEASAWNARGHMMVATVAWDHLSPSARLRVSALIKLNPHYDQWIEGTASKDRDLIAFVKAATWADEIKREAGYANGAKNPAPPSIGYADKQRHSEWHYEDLSFSPDGTPVEMAPPSNATTEILRMTAELRDGKASPEVKSYDLVWLMHLVGDVHQPLHATARYTRSLPEGDRGGNEISVCPTSCTSKPKTLHAFWDDLLGTGSKPSDAIERARKLRPADPKAVTETSPKAWLRESLSLAKYTAYASPIGLSSGPYELTLDYKQSAGRIAEKQIALAGERLAKLIESTMSD